jgi:hypothetical protein
MLAAVFPHNWLGGAGFHFFKFAATHPGCQMPLARAANGGIRNRPCPRPVLGTTTQEAPHAAQWFRDSQRPTRATLVL